MCFQRSLSICRCFGQMLHFRKKRGRVLEFWIKKGFYWTENGELGQKRWGVGVQPLDISHLRTRFIYKWAAFWSWAYPFTTQKSKKIALISDCYVLIFACRPTLVLRGEDPPLTAKYEGEVGVSREEAFKQCTRIVINSGVAIECGPHFDSDIMVALNICIQGKELLIWMCSLGRHRFM